MKETSRIAIIGGSKEANDLATDLTLKGVDVTVFEPANYRAPSGVQAVQYSGHANWNELLIGFDAVVIAPHPFSVVAFETNIDIPHIRLERAPWVATENDNWTIVDSAKRAAELLSALDVQKPLIAIGRERLSPFNQRPKPDLAIRYRRHPAPDVKLGSQCFYQPGPFSVIEELTFFRDEGIDCVVAHNAGGSGGWPKLEAARELQLPVILISRPDIAHPNKVTTVLDALIWLRQHVGLDVGPVSD